MITRSQLLIAGHVLWQLYKNYAQDLTFDVKRDEHVRNTGRIDEEIEEPSSRNATPLNQETTLGHILDMAVWFSKKCCPDLSSERIDDIFAQRKLSRK